MQIYFSLSRTFASYGMPDAKEESMHHSAQLLELHL